MSPANTPNATNNQISDWNRVHDLMLGIRAYDPEEHELGVLVQDLRYQVYWTYGALLNEKQNIAGRFNRYGTEAEHVGIDWNIMIQPFEDFMFMYEKALEHDHDKNKWPGIIRPGDPCIADSYTNDPGMWLEIGVGQTLAITNNVFPNTTDHCLYNGPALFSNDTVGAYGPFVVDADHGFNPEIHPAQQIWFRNHKDPKAGTDRYWLLFVQDATDRFAGWVNSPVHGQFLVAFRVMPQINSEFNIPLTIALVIERKEDVVTRGSKYALDSDNGTSHTLLYDRKKVVTVNERREDNNDMGIQFVDVARLENGMIQGYVQISMKIGDKNTSEHGYCIIKMDIVQPQSKLPANRTNQ